MNTASGNLHPPSSWTPDQGTPSKYYFDGNPVRGDEGKWQEALADYRRAEAAVAALERSPDEDAFGDAVVAMNRALERLLTAPAPDPAALATKLNLARRHLAWELPAGDAAMAAIEQDALRLSEAPRRA